LIFFTWINRTFSKIGEKKRYQKENISGDDEKIKKLFPFSQKKRVKK